MSEKPSPQDLAREEARIRRLRILVDLTASLLRQSDLPLAEAVHLVRAVRTQALRLFPDKAATYNLVYAPRFARILREKYGVRLEG